MQVAWKARLEGSFWATPVAVGDYLYCINSDGKAFVVNVRERGEIVAENDFGEKYGARPPLLQTHYMFAAMSTFGR